MVNNLKIVFFGTPIFTIPVLRELSDDGYNITDIFTSNGPIEEEAKKHSLIIFKPASLKKDKEVFEQFKNLDPDVCIIAAYGKIIPSSYLKVPKYGFINIHPSILPKYRGPSPIQTSIMNGDTETGVSIMIVDEELDHGPILASEKYKIPAEKYHDEIAGDLFKLGAKLLIKILPKYIKGELKPIEQDHSQTTFTKKFTREDSRVDWSRPAEKIYNRIRALNPEPGTWSIWKNKTLNIKQTECPICDVGQTTNHIPGTVIKVDVDSEIAVATKTCYLILKRIQLEGGKEMDVKSFLNGHPDFLGSKLE